MLNINYVNPNVYNFPSLEHFQVKEIISRDISKEVYSDPYNRIRSTRGIRECTFVPFSLLLFFRQTTRIIFRMHRARTRTGLTRGSGRASDGLLKPCLERRIQNISLSIIPRRALARVSMRRHASNIYAREEA